MTTDELKQILPTLPDSPGCYKYFDRHDHIIYVGKAKCLRRRVSSYFHKEHHDVKTRMLTRQIKRIEYIVVQTEFDALLLENALIKEHQPRYNVLLKDGKTYPEIVVRNEPFPRVEVMRQAPRDGSLHFGPFPSVQMARATLAMIRDIYPIRSCKLDLSPELIARGKYSVCLEYHMRRCKAPCISAQSKDDYDANIREVVQLLRGDMRTVIDLYREEMLALAEELRFEEAQMYKERLAQLEQYQAKHTVAPRHIHNVSVYSFERDEHSIYVNYLHIYEGMINKAHTLEYKAQIEEADEELFASVIMELRQRFDDHTREIILPFALEWDFPGISITVPKIGDKRKLLELSQRNAKQYRADKYKQSERLNPDQRMMQTLTELRDLLGLGSLPLHIECFDNSHIQGSDPVAACIVFKRAVPSKKDYRKYHIRGQAGADDYASMREVAHRRYSRMQSEGKAMPDLIIVDGGVGQMSAMREVLGALGLDIPLAGLAKDERHQTRSLLYGLEARELAVRHDSPTFRLLASIQSEVHRFAIGFHRDTRSKSQLISVLDYIKGIGPKSKEQLLQHFGSVKRIQEAEPAEIEALVGKQRAKRLRQALAEL